MDATIVHRWNGPKWPLVGGVVARVVIGPVFIHGIASRTLAGIKRLSSFSQEGAATVVAEFTLETDVKYAEQQVRDRVGATKATTLCSRSNRSIPSAPARRSEVSRARR